MIKFALCDDQSNELAQISKVLTHYLDKKNEVTSMDCFLSGHDLLISDKEHHFDIFILDIILPEMDGIDLAKALRARDEQCVIIFLTTSPDYALKSYEVNAFQYLLKPLDVKKLYQILDNIFPQILRRQNERLMVNTPKGITAVKAYDIAFVEHINHVLYIHLKNNIIVTTANSTLSLSDLETQLDPTVFLRPHRAFIVNMYTIFKLLSDGFILEDRTVIPIAGRRYSSIKEQYLDFLLNSRGGFRP